MRGRHKDHRIGGSQPLHHTNLPTRLKCLNLYVSARSMHSMPLAEAVVGWGISAVGTQEEPVAARDVQDGKIISNRCGMVCDAAVVSRGEARS